ncbi:MAG: hypothetical protein J6S80_00020 [Alphaproteobacteria bacterium]|nr:hypothetical protein [Alphaproteobacteria bacterium]
MIDKQKVQKVIKNMLNHEALFPYEKHESSAQIFDTELRKLGIVPAVEVCHPYKFPANFDEASFEQYIMQQIYIHLFDPERVLAPKKYIQHFYAGTDVPENVQQIYLSDLLKITGSLSYEEKEYVSNYFMTEQPQAVVRMKEILPELKKLNPEIDDINPQSAFDFYDLYIGMTSRFHPEDIKYFSTLTDFDEADKNQALLKSVLGIDPQFRIAPHRVKQLIDDATVKN